MKVKRIYGGSWLYGVRFVRCAFRGRYTPGDRNGLVGFRCCFSPLSVKINKERLKNES